VHDACLTSDETPPRLSASSNALTRHRAEIDPRRGLGMQEIGRRSPAWAPRPASSDAAARACRPRDASRPPSQAVRPPRRSAPPDRRRTGGRASSGSVPARSDLHGRGVGRARSPTPDQHRSWHRDDRPRSACRRARATRRWRRRQRAVDASDVSTPYSERLPSHRPHLGQRTGRWNTRCYEAASSRGDVVLARRRRWRVVVRYARWVFGMPASLLTRARGSCRKVSCRRQRESAETEEMPASRFIDPPLAASGWAPRLVLVERVGARSEPVSL
jgi:hypothetical protein